MLEYTRVDDLGADDVERLRACYEPLTEAVRDLIDATIRTEVGPEQVREAISDIETVTRRLRRSQRPGSFGIRYSAEGEPMPWGNAVVGLRNPSAPPLVVQRLADGSVRSDFVLGAAFEGPPGHAHGGVSAELLDHVLGEAVSAPDVHRLTGTLTLRYLRLTPLGKPLHVVARLTRTDGVKTYAEGHIADEDGPTVHAEGVFIEPRWARQ